MATAGVPLWSTTAASNSTADPSINFAEGMAPSAVNDSGRALMASVAKWRDDLYGLTTSGTSTAFTVTTNATYASVTALSGAVFTIIPNATSGATPTLAVDGLTARALNISTGVAIPTGALVSGTPYLIKYVHASTEFIVIGAVGKDLLTSLDIINGTSLSSIATDDTFPIYDLSATANRRILVSDVLKVVNSLTADATPDTAADYVMTYDASATAAKKVLLQNLPGRLPRGYIDGCTLSNNGTDATNDIDIAAGVCRDSTNAVDITVAAMAGKQLDANWVAGASAGMRNSAVGITDTTYHIYAVAKADGTQDIYAHTSVTVATVITALQAETGGANYLYARRLGSITRSTAIRGFVQNGNHFRLKVANRDINASNPGTGAVTHTMLSVPTGIVIELDASVSLLNVTTSYYWLASALDETATTPSATAFSYRVDIVPSVFGGPLRVKLNTSAQFRSQQSSSGASDNTSITAQGWWDNRGENA